MAYRSPLGGSPLGLIGLKSSVPPGSPSSFNAGKTRNINVDDYNKSKPMSTGTGETDEGNSIFTGNRVLRPWPIVSTENTLNGDYKRSDIHNDSIYDTSILNIIEKLANTKGSLKSSDFAYLKNIGVYPNNRLMIARRFATPSMDNIMVKRDSKELSSLATLISWLPENSDFLDITFGEEWVDAEADFKGVLTSLGDDLTIGNLGGKGGAFGNAIPLPGFTEIFQRRLLSKMGVIDEENKNVIPAGNPNIIKEAKRRKLVGYGAAGSGLSCAVSIKMVCEYEMKFISGIDPTIVWMDLLAVITRFGSSESISYGLDVNFAEKAKKWTNDPKFFIEDITQKLQESISELVEAADTVLTSLKKLTEQPTKLLDIDNSTFKGLVQTIQNGIIDGAKSLVQKYRVKIIGIINALSGLPSTPWHITIGNPLRPTFCSGDMITTAVNLKLGPTLMFNDLPSSITVEFTLTNARPWGIQEIMSKFNSGYLRTVSGQKTYYETDAGINGEFAGTGARSDVKGGTSSVPKFLQPVKKSTIAPNDFLTTTAAAGIVGASVGGIGIKDNNKIKENSNIINPDAYSNTSVIPILVKKI